MGAIRRQALMIALNQDSLRNPAAAPPDEGPLIPCLLSLEGSNSGLEPLNVASDTVSALASSVSELVWVIDLASRTVVLANAMAMAATASPYEMVGLHLSQAFDPEVATWLEGHIQTMAGKSIPLKSDCTSFDLAGQSGVSLRLSATFAVDGLTERLVVVGALEPRGDQVNLPVSGLAWDAMTSMPNRAGFQSTLASRLAETITANQSGAVMVLDLDRFKLVNDVHGHAVGDVVLSQAAQRLKRCLPRNGRIARLGGDEFAILLHDISDPLEARILAQLVVDALQAPFVLGDREVRIGVSLGVVLYDDEAMTSDTVLKHADLALRKAKADGRGHFVFYDPSLEAARRVRRNIETEIRPALMRGDFEAFYQPQLDIVTGQISGFEALARWNHPARGWIPPGEFISAAEELGLIERLGAQMLTLACRSAASWPKPLPVAVNVSSLQLRNRGFVSTVFQSLARAGLPTDRLELEITESVLLDDDPNVLDGLNQLRALGVRLSLDDFGTGYASLSYLRRLPLNKVKIDQSFVHDLATNSGARAIVSAVSHLARDLGMTVTAEGVETQEQLDILSIVGCTHAQGYLIGRPDPDPIARMNTGTASPVMRR